MHRLSRLGIVFAAIAPNLVAQSIWIVDQQNGPGTIFTTIQPAIDTAVAGDRIIIRAGTYFETVTIDKGVALLGEGRVVVDSGLAFGVMNVVNVPAGEVVSLHNLSVRFASVANSVRVVGSAGRVHLQNITVTAPGSPSRSAAGVLIENSAAVTILGSAIEGRPAVSVRNSYVTIADSDLDGLQFSGGGFGAPIASAGPGVFAWGGDVRIARCDISGGRGAASSGSTADNQPAIDIRVGSSVVLHGTSANSCVAGASASAPGAPAIRNDGTLTYDPSIVLTPAAGQAPVQGSGVTTSRPLVGLGVTGGQLGGMVNAEVASAPGDAMALLAAPPIVPIATLFDDVHVDLAASVALVYAAMQPASGLTQTGFSVPNDAGLLGLAYGLQAANLHRGSGILEFSNVGVFVVH